MFWKFQEKLFKKTCDWACFFLSSTFLVSNFTKTELLYKSFQGFFLGYQFTLLPVHSLWLIVGRGFLTPFILWRVRYIPYPSFWKFCPTPLSCRLQPSPPPIFLTWLNWWLCHILCVILLNNSMDLYVSTLGTLIPEGPCHVFYATRLFYFTRLLYSVKFTKIWHISLFVGTLIWYHTNLYRQRHTSHSRANKLAHPYKCILTRPAMYSQQLSVLHWIIHWYQKMQF